MIRDTVPSVKNFYESAVVRDAYRPLDGDVTADVCVVGGGIAGCSTALHLAQRGYRVVLLEESVIGHGASGRSGGQLLPGYSSGQDVLVRQLGKETAHHLWDISVEAIQLALSLIKEHSIECDLKFGHIDAAIKPRHRDDLLRHMDQLQKDYQYQNTRFLERSELRTFIHSDRYIAGLYDEAAASIHPLAYTLGLARAAISNGVVIHEHTKVKQVQRRGDLISIETHHGIVSSKYAVLGANISNNNLLPDPPRILPVATYMIATEQLANVAGTLMSPDIAVSDCNFILDYFRINSSRLLFGGGISYSGHPSSINAHYTRQRMLKVFPQLKSIKIDYAWHGMLDMSMNRAPDFGRVDNNIYYLQGFSGHGMALTTMAGKLVAESIATQSEKFDLFSRIKHQPFPGGALRTPLFVLAMLWYRLRDAL